MDERTIEQIKEDNVTRLRRSEAWIKNAEKTEFAKDDTSRFIFYWIAFNAQYSNSIQKAEKVERKEFFDKIFDEDKNGKLEVIFKNKSAIAAIEKIFELPQTYFGFWRKPWKKIENMKQWENYFNKKRYPPENKKQELEDLFSRLSIVRNQIFHGGHSGNKDDYYDSSIQVEKGAEVLSNFIPCFFDIIQSSVKENPCTNLWGEIIYRKQSKPGEVDCPPPWLLESKK